MEFNLAQIFDTVAAAIPDRDCIVSGDRRFSFADIAERTNRLANVFHSHGIGVHRERDELSGWESGQDHVGLYLYNGNEYLESMVGAYKARVAPFNVNYRYVEEELTYLLNDSSAAGLVYHGSFAPIVEQVRSAVPSLRLLLQVDDGSGMPLLDGALDFEAALADAPATAPPTEPSPDDLYVLYTGGTTGMPKGVLWRQADIYCGALGGNRPGMGEFDSLAEIADSAQMQMRYLPSPPFMHGAAHWAAFNAFHAGSTVVVQGKPETLDADDIWSTVEREKVQVLLIVGDAFARPLLDGLGKRDYDLSSLSLVVSGGAVLGVPMKEALIEKLPNISIMDAIGSSETGSQGMNVSSAAGGVTTGTFMPQPGNCVLSEDLQRVLEPGSAEVGWFAKAGRVPLGYLGDQAKTEKTYPVVHGVRYSVPGDRARQLEDGSIEVLGRDSVTINSGGEKIFAEEVEQAIKSHPGVYDAVVVGRPSERWGNEVVAVVALREGFEPTPEELKEECSRHIARYKLPKDVVFRDAIVRSPSGKADYRWAKEQATA